MLGYISGVAHHCTHNFMAAPRDLLVHCDFAKEEKNSKRGERR